jgi:23S rRNA (cytidine1920-2'-O)/16S rRNA (cytidine1409-2'-O)-methyltransferase
MGGSFVRLDKLLVDRGLSASRERAQALILAAKVLVDGQRITKAGQRVAAESNLQVLGEDHPFASRGGLKLEHALEQFRLDVRGLVAMDVGASTGGFTDCLLQHDVKRVYAVDVGYGQLAWKLRQDPRVVVLERQNIRYLAQDRIPEPIQIATIDASFISLKLVIPAVAPFLDRAAAATIENTASRQDSTQDSTFITRRRSLPHPLLVALIKPQFEAGRAHVGKGGVVRDQKVHQAVCDSLAEFCQSLGFELGGIIPSPILGPKGNVEFLLVAAYKPPREVIR